MDLDKVFNVLAKIDWESIEVAERVSGQALEVLCQPGPLRELLGGVVTDQRLLGLSERHAWGDRVVLWDDPENQWRIRLHRFEDRADEPHSHRWPFHTRVLHGSYHHALYGPEKWVREEMEKGHQLPPPSFVRREVAGSSYAIDSEMVHCVKTEADTFSVIVQGPRFKREALRVRNGQIAWQTGRAQEASANVQNVLTTPDRLAEVATIAHGRGLLDSAHI
jgi:hypothetical protein